MEFLYIINLTSMLGKKNLIEFLENYYYTWCMYVHSHTHTHTTHTQIYACTLAHSHTRKYTCMHICTLAHTQVYMHAHLHARTCASDTCTHASVHTCTLVHLCIYTHVHHQLTLKSSLQISIVVFVSTLLQIISLKVPTYYIYSRENSGKKMSLGMFYFLSLRRIVKGILVLVFTPTSSSSSLRSICICEDVLKISQIYAFARCKR